MGVDPSQVNAVGDLVVTDPQALRALVDPLRRRLVDLVQRLGPVTAAVLAAETTEDVDVVEQHLRALEAAGLLDAAGERWSTPARGIFFEIPPEGAEAQRAARALTGAMVAEAAELPSRWVRDVEPELELDWARAAGLFGAGVFLVPDELRALQDGLETLLAPFTSRPEAERPPGAARVRVLAFFLPEPRPGEERAI